MTAYHGNTNAAKISPETVIEIRQDYKGGATFGDLADNYGITYGNIKAIVYRKNWKHVEETNKPRMTKKEEMALKKLGREWRKLDKELSDCPKFSYRSGIIDKCNHVTI